MTEAVVFDLFHTLIDSVVPDGYDPVTLISRCAGLDRSDFEAFWSATYRERETTPIDVVDLVDRFSDGRLTVLQRSEIDRILGHYRDLAVMTPEPGAVALVEAMSQETGLGLLSNAYEREVRAWSRSPLAPFFDVAVFSYEVGAMKPDLRMYHSILRELGIEAPQAVFVGNGASGELVGARDAGFGRVVHCNIFDRMNGLATKAEQAERASQADASVESFDELAGALALPEGALRSPSVSTTHVVAGILRRDDKVLLGHRRPDGDWYPNVWDLPGGHVKPGESRPEALRRELAEELGIDARPADAPWDILRIDDVRLDLFLIDTWQGEPANGAPDEHDDLRWVGPSELGSIELAHPSYVHILAAVLRN